MKKTIFIIFIIAAIVCFSFLMGCTPSKILPSEKGDEEIYAAMKDVKIEKTASDAFLKDCLLTNHREGAGGKVISDMNFMYSFARFNFNVPSGGTYILSVRYYADPLTKWGAFINETNEYKLDFIGDRTFRTLALPVVLNVGENTIKIRNTMGNGYFAFIDRVAINGISTTTDALKALDYLTIKEGEEKLNFPKIPGFSFSVKDSCSTSVALDGTINQLPFDVASPTVVTLKIAASRADKSEVRELGVVVPVIYPSAEAMLNSVNKIFNLKKGETQLKLEDMTSKGYNLGIGYSQNSNAISLTGFVNAQKLDQFVNIKLRLEKVSTGEVALSNEIKITIPGLGYDVPSATFVNPLGEGEDPYINFIDNKYYHIQAQHGAANARLEIVGSDSFLDYKVEGFKTIYTFPPYSSKEWNCTEIWGPFPMFKWQDGHYYIYYAASNGNNVNHRQGVLKSKSLDPMGEYEDLGIINTSDSDSNTNPTVDNTVWAIGATTFLGNDDSRYMVWSGWKNNGDQWPQRTYMAKIRSPKDIGARILLSSPEYAWEGCDKGTPLMEGQAVFNVNGKVFMLYSADSSWAGRYSLGILEYRGNDSGYLNKSNWVKKDKPIFVSTSSIEGPGGASLVPTKNGNEWWLLYHSSMYKGSGWVRNVSAKPIYFDEDGFPVLGSPVAYYENVRMPSGDSFLRQEMHIARADTALANGNVKLFYDPSSSSGVCLSGFKKENDSASFAITVPKNGYYTILVRYAAITDETTHRLSVNSIAKPMEGYTYLGKNNYHTLTSGAVLKAGKNEITLQYIKGYDVKIDFVAAYYSGE